MTRPIVIRVVEGHARAFRHTWRGTTVSALVTPVLFLAAMGMGLGSLVDQGPTTTGLGDLPYLVWLAPGLLVVSNMQTGAGDGAFPVMAGVRWVKSYESAIATPVRPWDLQLGNLLWSAARLTVVATVFVVVATIFGAMPLVSGLRALGPAVLTGVSATAVVSAFMVTRRSDEAVSGVFRFVIVPLFLFSGAFFPLSELPSGVRPLARVNPVWHGVELSRAAALQIPTTLGWPVHLGVLLLVVAAGLAAGRRTFTRRLRR